jgi:hypothetical protein
MTDDVVIVQPWPKPAEDGQLELGGEDRQLELGDGARQEPTASNADSTEPRNQDGEAAELEDQDREAADLPEHDIDLGYLAVALAQTIAQGGCLYEAKLYTKRVAQLTIEVPVDAEGKPDIKRQRQIAAVVKRLDQIRSKLQETGIWSKGVRLA